MWYFLDILKSIFPSQERFFHRDLFLIYDFMFLMLFLSFTHRWSLRKDSWHFCDAAKLKFSSIFINKKFHPKTKMIPGVDVWIKNKSYTSEMPFEKLLFLFASPTNSFSTLFPSTPTLASILFPEYFNGLKTVAFYESPFDPSTWTTV